MIRELAQIISRQVCMPGEGIRQCSSILLCYAPQPAPEAASILRFSAPLGCSPSVLSSFCRQGNTGKMHKPENVDHSDEKN